MEVHLTVYLTALYTVHGSRHHVALVLRRGVTHAVGASLATPTPKSLHWARRFCFLRATCNRENAHASEQKL